MCVPGYEIDQTAAADQVNWGPVIRFVKWSYLGNFGERGSVLQFFLRPLNKYTDHFLHFF